MTASNDTPHPHPHPKPYLHLPKVGLPVVIIEDFKKSFEYFLFRQSNIVSWPFIRKMADALSFGESK